MVRRRNPPFTGKRVTRFSTFKSTLSVPLMGIGSGVPSGALISFMGSGSALPRISPSFGTAASSACV
jgi:hypothetical protein